MLGIIFQKTFILFLLYNLLCGGLLVIDYYISPDEKQLVIESSKEETLSIYEKEPINLYVYNKSPYKINLEIKDEVPNFHFRVENKVIKGSVMPHEKKHLSYVLTPTKRGAYIFHNIYLRFEGRLGLCIKSSKVNFEREYKVYPNLKNLRKYRLSICNNRLFKMGQRNIKSLGRGTSFESLREYVSGDEYKKINWKASARGNKLIVNQYEPEKNQHVYIFIDTGRPMSYTVRGNRKLDLVVNTALVLSDIINQGGDQSGLLLFNKEVNKMLMPGRGIAHRGAMLETLYHIDHTNETSNFIEAFHQFKMKERNRSIIFLFTDFTTHEEAEDLLKVLPIISKNNIVIVMLIRNEGLETIANQEAKDEEELFNKGVALEFLADRKKVVSILNRRGVFCIETVAESLEYTAVNKYIQLKNNTFL